MQNRVLITGAASGLGKALAFRWARAGADICVADINKERGDEVVTELKKLGVKAFYQHCDITSDSDVQAAKDAVLKEFKGIDLVVNNAGVASVGTVSEESVEQWEWVLNINVLGAVRIMHAFLPLLKESHGYVLNVASQAGLTSLPSMGSYAASKAAMVSFSETLRLELVDDQIGCSVLCPAFFKTNLDESVRSDNPAMRGVVSKLLEKATVTADEVADAAFQGVQKRQHVIQSHPEGRKASLFKRLFPERYLKMMDKQTLKFRKKLGGKQKGLHSVKHTAGNQV